jgi:hypothetical protein
MKKLNIGKDFSPDPAGRFYTDGDASGEQFREEVLKDLVLGLTSGDFLDITLDDGVDSYGSSFLNEAFAGMVKYGYIQGGEFLKRIRFTYTNNDFSFYEAKIKQYIGETKFATKQYKSSKIQVKD